MLDSLPWVQISVALLLIFLTKIIYTLIIKPYKVYCFYKKVLSEQYKAEIQPFTITGTDYLTRRDKELKLYNDVYHTAKTELTQCQVRLMKVGSDILIDLIDNQLITEYYQKTKERYYQKDMNFPGFSALKNIIGEGLFLSEGDAWKKKKKILSKIFNHEFIYNLIPAISEIAEQNFNALEAKEENLDKDVIAVKFQMLFSRIFGSIVIKSFFGELQNDKIDGEDIYEYVSKTLSMNSKRTLTVFAFILGSNFYKYNLRAIDREVNSRSTKFVSFCEETIRKLIEKLRKENDGQKKEQRRGGIIDWVIKNNMLTLEGLKTKDEDEKYTVKELIDEVGTFFLAGTDTTSTLTSNLIYTLSKHPEVINKMRKQISQVVGSSAISESLLKKCVYLDCVVKEGLRFLMPAPTLGVRQVLKDHYLGKIPMKKGLKVTVKIITNHYKQQFYSNPLEFNPERWNNIDQSKIPPYSFFPFSAGHRVCIGQHLAVLEAKIILIHFLKRYESIELEKKEYKLENRLTYGAEIMFSFLTKRKTSTEMI